LKIAIISDIHGNLEALQTALKYIQSQGITRIICLGDIVGYGPFPNECVELTRKYSEKCLLGNHDAAAIDQTDISFFNQYAKDAALWTRKVLTEYNKQYLANLPLEYQEGDVLYVHSTPENPETWDYIQSEFEARMYMQRISARVVFIGHSHIPVVFSHTEGAFYEEDVPLEENDKYIINVGSIGQPRDGDPRLCFVIFDIAENHVQYVRLDYDIQKTYEAILENKLPPFLAMRLLSGH